MRDNDVLEFGAEDHFAPNQRRTRLFKYAIISLISTI
jgi:hypothetical protein